MRGKEWEGKILGGKDGENSKSERELEIWMKIWGKKVYACGKYIYFLCEQNKLDTVEKLEYCNKNNPIFSLSLFFFFFCLIFFREFKLMASTLNNNYLSSN